MKATDQIILNFKEIRRRSTIVWNSIPIEYLNWKPDKDALTIIEMIRHVLEGEHLFHKIIENRGVLGSYQSPWEELDYIDVPNEMKICQAYRERFISMISGLSDVELQTARIERKELGQSRLLGDYLNRIAYHESVHTGQLLSYLRTLGIDRPLIWD